VLSTPSPRAPAPCSPGARSPGCYSTPPALSAWRVALPRNYCALQQRTTCTTWTRGARLLLSPPYLRDPSASARGPFLYLLSSLATSSNVSNDSTFPCNDVIECFNWRLGESATRNGISPDFLTILRLSSRLDSSESFRIHREKVIGRNRDGMKGSVAISSGITWDFGFPAPVSVACSRSFLAHSQRVH